MKKLITSALVAAVLLLPALTLADPSVASYEKGKPCYRKLMGAGGAAAPDKQWRECISLFEAVYRDYPTGVKAPGSLYSSGRLKLALYEKTKSTKEAEGAIKDFNLLIREFPKSSLADDCLYLIGVLRRDATGQKDRAATAFSYLIEHYPTGDMAPKARVALERLGGAPAAKQAKAEGDEQDSAPAAEAAAGPSTSQAESKTSEPAPAARGAATEHASAFSPATIEAIRVNEGAEATSVEFTLDKNVEYSIEYTESGPRTRSPARLEVSILHAAPADGLEKKREVGSTRLISYKVKKMWLSSGVKADFRMAPGTRYEITNAGGILTVLFSGGSPDAAPQQHEQVQATGEVQSNLRIVIDPGHGGNDEGAVGPRGTKEKDVTLSISKRLANELKRKMGARVWLTRTSDKYLTLEERHEYAVRKKADLFISIHANASRNKEASGVETYYLNNATDEAARRLAQRENRATRKKMSQVEHILSTMLQNYDTAESRELAREVQGRLARASRGGVKNRGVRSALFYVLVGAKCPAILVETAFISNPREEKLLVSGRYQKGLATAVAEGVQRYLSRRDDRLVSL